MGNFLIGSFQSCKSPQFYLQALVDMYKCDANCLMCYTGAPQTSFRSNIPSNIIEQFKQLAKKNNFDFANLIIHAPYIINLASSDKDKQHFAISYLNKELERCAAIGCTKLVVHPGNLTDNISLVQGITNCANVINSLDNKKNVTICLETMSGKGTELGKNFSELKEIINMIKNKKNIGVCLDTCHIYDAGYDITLDYKKVINEFDNIIGLNYLKVIHVNDSKNICNSHKDRHDNIGYGNIGFDNIINFIYDSRFSNIPKILETPLTKDCVYTYTNEIKNIRNKKFIKWR